MDDPLRSQIPGGAQPRPIPPEVLEELYEPLRDIARRLLASAAPGQSLNATALVHDAWVQLAEESQFSYVGQRSLLSYVSTKLRHIIVDHYRRARALRRGGGLERVPLQESVLIAAESVPLSALDAALSTLERINARQAQVVQMRYFGGMSDADIAAELGVTVRTVSTDFQTARTWLRAKLEEDREP